MARHSSATPRGRGDGETGEGETRRPGAHLSHARLLITNSSIPKQTRSFIRYALEINRSILGSGGAAG